MLTFNFIATAFAASAILAPGGATAQADSQSGFFIAYRPGIFVQYLSLSDPGPAGSGYLEAIRAVPGNSGGETRTQTFVKRNGTTISFGAYTATRTAQGFTLTAMTQEGQVVQQSFVRTTISAINASITALATSVSRSHERYAQDSAKAELRNYVALSAADSARLSKAQGAVDSASLQLIAAQSTADHFSAIAVAARAAANAAIDKPGVSLAQNQGRIDAMKTADDAELTVVNAERAVNVAQAAVGSARGEVSRLRLGLAEAADRSRALATHLATGDGVGP